LFTLLPPLQKCVCALSALFIALIINIRMYHFRTRCPYRKTSFGDVVAVCPACRKRYPNSYLDMKSCSDFIFRFALSILRLCSKNNYLLICHGFAGIDQIRWKLTWIGWWILNQEVTWRSIIQGCSTAGQGAPAAVIQTSTQDSFSFPPRPIKCSCFHDAKAKRLVVFCLTLK
jgi:hypothetical protein